MVNQVKSGNTTEGINDIRIDNPPADGKNYTLTAVNGVLGWKERPALLTLEITPIAGSEVLFGKSVSDLQENIVIGSTGIAGTSKYVTGYTGFSSKTEEQSGNYIALHAATNQAATIVFNGQSNVTLDADGDIVIRLRDGVTSLRFTATNALDVITVELSIENLVKQAQPEPQPTPTGLTPFEDNQTVSGIRFDTQALTTVLENAIVGTTLPNYESMPCLYVDDSDVVSFTKLDDVVVFGTPTMDVFWISGAFADMGINDKGWYVADLTDPENPTIAPLEDNIYDYSLSGTVTYVGFNRPGSPYKEGIDTTFGLLNGVVVGAVEE